MEKTYIGSKIKEITVSNNENPNGTYCNIKFHKGLTITESLLVEFNNVSMVEIGEMLGLECNLLIKIEKEDIVAWDVEKCIGHLSLLLLSESLFLHMRKEYKPRKIDPCEIKGDRAVELLTGSKDMKTLVELSNTARIPLHIVEENNKGLIYDSLFQEIYDFREYIEIKLKY